MKTTIITAILILSSLSLSATTKNGQLKGTVIESNSKIPMAYATIEVSNPESTIMMEVTTDANGLYLIEDIPAGEYTLKVSDLGYKEVSTKINVKDGFVELKNIEVDEDREIWENIQNNYLACK